MRKLYQGHHFGMLQEWICAYPGCKIILNDLTVKSQRQKYCTPHRQLKILEDTRARCKRWYSKKK